LLDTRNESVVVSAMSYFPQFVRLHRSTSPKDSVVVFNDNRRTFSYDSISHTETEEYHLHTEVENCYMTLSSSVLDDLLSGKYWMISLFRALENLPFSITISEAIEREYFPLVYVNTAFETMTGHNRCDILGRSCKFLQTSYTEQDSLISLSIALRTAKPERVVLTNINKYGDIFKNFLLTKPVFDVAGRYRFVVGIQINASLSSCCAAELIMAENFINMFPNRVFVNT